MSSVGEQGRQKESLPRSPGCPGAGSPSSPAVADPQHSAGGQGGLSIRMGCTAIPGKTHQTRALRLKDKAEHGLRERQHLEIPEAERAGLGKPRLHAASFPHEKTFWKEIRV